MEGSGNTELLVMAFWQLIVNCESIFDYMATMNYQ